MPYTPTTWSDGVTAVNAAHMNNIETVYTEATNSFEQDLFTPFVYTGLVCTADGTTLNQLDVTAGVAFLRQSSDSTLRRRATAASVANQFLTSTPSTTYYLDLNPDGTFSFATTHSGAANYLTICSATTDTSGNILAVTDARALTTELFFNNGVLATLNMPGGKQVNLNNTASGGGVTGKIQWNDPDTSTAYIDLNSDKLRIVGNYLGAGAQTLWTLSLQSRLLSLMGAVSLDNGNILSDGAGTVSGKSIAAPGAPTLALTTGTNLGTGVYKYLVTFTTALGESATGTQATITTTTGNQAVNLSAIPTSSSLGVTGRNIYRTKVGGSTFFLLHSIADNTTTTYSDTTADASLPTTQPPTHPSIGGSIWKNSGGSILAQVYGDGAIFDVSGRVAVQGGQSLGQPALSYGSGVPGSLATNEIYFQIS